MDDFIEASDMPTLDKIEEKILELEPDTITSLEKECAIDVPSYFHVKIHAASEHLMTTPMIFFRPHTRQQLGGCEES